MCGRIRATTSVQLVLLLVAHISGVFSPWCLAAFLPPWCLPGCPNGSFPPPWCFAGSPIHPFLPPGCLASCPMSPLLPPWCLAQKGKKHKGAREELNPGPLSIRAWKTLTLADYWSHLVLPSHREARIAHKGKNHKGARGELNPGPFGHQGSQSQHLSH